MNEKLLNFHKSVDEFPRYIAEYDCFDIFGRSFCVVYQGDKILKKLSKKKAIKMANMLNGSYVLGAMEIILHMNK